MIRNAKGYSWNNANEVKVLYKNASIVGNNRVILTLKAMIIAWFALLIMIVKPSLLSLLAHTKNMMQ
jgi:hypothetical protein